MNNTERNLRRRLKKSIRKRTELNNRILKALNFIKLLRMNNVVTISDLDLLEKMLKKHLYTEISTNNKKSTGKS